MPNKFFIGLRNALTIMIPIYALLGILIYFLFVYEPERDLIIPEPTNIEFEMAKLYGQKIKVNGFEGYRYQGISIFDRYEREY